MKRILINMPSYRFTGSHITVTQIDLEVGKDVIVTEVGDRLILNIINDETVNKVKNYQEIPDDYQMD